jgi:hypothetical protein
MVVRFGPPPTLYLSTSPPPIRMQFDARHTTSADFPPWPVAPDILFDRRTRSFVGLAYGISPGYHAYVRELADRHGSSSVRYSCPDSDFPRTAYSDSEAHYLEVIWGDIPADSFSLAQLAEDGWYYWQDPGSVASLKANVFADDEQESMIKMKSLAAVGISGVQDILQSYDLIIPGSFCLPASRLESVLDK